MEYLNPLVDYVFKKIFGTSENRDILIRFLNDFFNDPSQVIVDLQILNPLNEIEYPNDKDTALDIKVQTEDGRWINVEVQIAPDLAMQKRSLFYWSKMYGGQLESGEHYVKLEKTIMINILSFQLFEHNDILSSYHITRDGSHERLTDDLEIHFVELRKLASSQQELNDELRAWLLFLTDPENSLLEEIIQEVKEMKKAVNVLKAMSQSKEERERAESREKALKDQATLWELGMAKGIDMGKIGALASSLTIILSKRFGTLPKEMYTLIDSADARSLETAIDHAWDFQKLEDTTDYLSGRSH